MAPPDDSDIPDLPADLAEFLRAGRPLDYAASACEAGQVTLYSYDDVPLMTVTMHCASTPFTKEDPNKGKAGCYQIPAFDLVASCTGDYEPEGILLWLPAENRYGTWDPDHDLVMIFPEGTTWSQIAANPAPYLNAQWTFEDLPSIPTEYLRPWPAHPFR